MRTIEVKILRYDELSEKAKTRAIEENCDWHTHYDWWDSIQYDWIEVGGDKGNFFFNIRYAGTFDGTVSDPQSMCKTILSDHGEGCQTHKTAKEYSKYFDEANCRITALNRMGEDDCVQKLEEELEEVCEDFVKSIQADYLQMLKDEYEYITSREAIEESFRANEIEFTEDGKIYN